jgi:alkylhydroperoxidase family enzyme
LFTEEERIALQMTEEMTRIADKGLTEETYQRAKGIFTDHEIAQIIVAIGVINIWKRFAVPTHMIFERF